MNIQRPFQNEYPFQYQPYIDLVSEINFFEALQDNTRLMLGFWNNIDTTKHNYRYAPDKWSIKDVFMHVIDTERGLSYRTIVCLRGDSTTPLYPMDENLYAANVDLTHRSMESMVEEFAVVRRGLEIMFENATEAQSTFCGNFKNQKTSARAFGYIAIGHALHHVNVVKKRYLR